MVSLAAFEEAQYMLTNARAGAAVGNQNELSEASLVPVGQTRVVVRYPAN